jgi:hypothetical protein
MAWVGRNGYPVPAGSIPDETIAGALERAGASIHDLERFLHTEYGQRLADPPTTWKHVSVSVLHWLATYGKPHTSTTCDRERERWKDQMRKRQNA